MTERARVELLCGDVLDLLSGRVGECEGAVLDPPSGISFMGRKFDTDHGGDHKWIEHMAPRFAAVREACIPGAYGLFWAIPRTQDWTMQALRRAGWHITDVIQHVFGQGWPKGKGQLKPAQEAWILCRDPRGKVRPLNIDECRVRRSWAERPESWFRSGNGATMDEHKVYGPKLGNGIHAHDAGSWPTNFFLTHAPCCMQIGTRTVPGSSPASGPSKEGRSVPLSRGAMNGTSAEPAFYGREQAVPAWECLAACSCGLTSLSPSGGEPTPCSCGEPRWWVCPVAEIDAQSGYLTTSGTAKHGKPSTYIGSSATHLYGKRGPNSASTYNCEGGASRFYPTFHYDAKAARKERQAGCEGLLWVLDNDAPIGWRLASVEEHAEAPAEHRREGNVHPTIKPIGCGEVDGLMRRLVRLVTPDHGPVLDGMMGSGSTGIAAMIEGRAFLGCDIDPGAVAIAEARIAYWASKRPEPTAPDAGQLGLFGG